ncbi:hypothetical protein [Marinilactibacillus sp. Marseille-P9653]|uniref:hypothetical protein n=1 Tax=Marinilactibacillus sp. Marseille-P9653 TaxID=2866583 RepID=UPI001CE41CF8|nr:hypothetical protein [Marinilactibacillus sp. Marseille-P9653]
MAKIKIFIQTVLNFLALNLLLNPIMNTLLPVSAVGGMLSLFYWGMLLIGSYALSIFLIESKQ